MEPDKPQNYWTENPESNQIAGTYQPTNSEPASAENTPEPATTNTEQPVVDSAPSQEVEKPQDFQTAEPIHWTGKEYIDQDHNWLWFIGFFIVVAGLIALDIFWMKAYTFSAIVVVMAIAVIVYDKRPARDINYTLSADQGLYIGNTLHSLSEYKSFSLINDRGHNLIILIPVKRFQPGTSVYFPEEVGEKIVDILGTHLPMEQGKLDFIDIIVRKLRL